MPVLCVLQFILDCKDEKGVEKSLSVSANISYESLRNLLRQEYGRPVSFIYESQGLCTVDDEASFQKCIEHVRSHLEKKGVSPALRLEAFILDLDRIPRKSRSLNVRNNDARAIGAPSQFGDPRRSSDRDARFDLSSSRVAEMQHQTSNDRPGLRAVTRSASSIPGHRPRMHLPGQNSRISWDFEGRFRQIDALMGQAEGRVASANGELSKEKSVPRSTKTTALRYDRANDLRSVDAAEAQVTGPHKCTHFPSDDSMHKFQCVYCVCIVQANSS
jgi:hypothetical protein